MTRKAGMHSCFAILFGMPSAFIWSCYRSLAGISASLQFLEVGPGGAVVGDSVAFVVRGFVGEGAVASAVAIS